MSKSKDLAKLISSKINHAVYDNDLGLMVPKAVQDQVSSTRLFMYDEFLMIESAEVPAKI